MISSIEAIPLGDTYDCTLFGYDDHTDVYLARILAYSQDSTTYK